MSDTYTLKVFITGLCTFVPTRREPPREMCVLFANAKDEQRIQHVFQKYRKHDGNALQPHCPVVQFPLRNRVTNVPSHPLFEDSEAVINGLWSFDQADLEILVPKDKEEEDNQEDPNTLDYKADLGPSGNPTTPCSNPGPDNFYFLAPARGDQGIRKVRNGLLSEDPNLLRQGEHLAARMWIREGKRLRPVSFSQDGDSREYFIYEVGGVSQALATVVELCFEIPKCKQVRLRARHWDSLGNNGSHNRDRYLILEHAPCDDGVVEIWVLNRESEEIYNQNPLFDVDGNGRNKVEAEYLFYEELLEPNGKPLTAPVLSKRDRIKLTSEVEVKSKAMERIYFSAEDGENGKPGGTCSPNVAEA